MNKLVKFIDKMDPVWMKLFLGFAAFNVVWVMIATAVPGLGSGALLWYGAPVMLPFLFIVDETALETAWYMPIIVLSGFVVVVPLFWSTLAYGVYRMGASMKKR